MKPLQFEFQSAAKLRPVATTNARICALRNPAFMYQLLIALNIKMPRITLYDAEKMYIINVTNEEAKRAQEGKKSILYRKLM